MIEAYDYAISVTNR